MEWKIPHLRSQEGAREAFPALAKVGRRTGKVTFVGKGTCKVWAKAHNGKNSPKVKVRVR